MSFGLLRKKKTVDELQLRQERELGEKAQALLRDETLAKAFADVEMTYLTGWRNSTLEQVELRERAHIAVNMLAGIRNQLIAYVKDGAVAAKQLEAEITRAA